MANDPRLPDKIYKGMRKSPTQTLSTNGEIQSIKQRRLKMSLLTKKQNNAASTGNTDFAPSEGWHEVRIVGVADIGEEPNKFQDGKLQAKISVLFAFDEVMEFGDKEVQKTKVEKFTASLHEKSGLVTKILAPAGHSVESFDQLIGLTMRLKLKKDGNWTNIANCDESEKALAASSELYVPKFWIVNAEGEATGYDMITEDGVIEEVRVANAEAKAVDKPAAKAPAVDSDVDMYE
jgi:hypothetical protein